MAIPARTSIVTLGVRDLPRSVAFYAAIGWERCASSMDEIAWFRTVDTYVGLFPYEDLAEDAQIADPSRGTFGGMTLAINLESEAAVVAALDEAVAAGATILRPAEVVPFGFRGYFADPDGYPWEVCYNPGFPILESGRIHIP
jgi:predicted lactoylglutathione lyase